jgi:hypothetical protein
MKRIGLIIILLIILISGTSAESPLWQGKGRIVISSDGNEHDHDDWAATPLSLALISAKGLQDKLSLYIFSDHIWGSNYEHPGVDGVTPYEQMKISAVDGGKVFGFKNTRFICGVDNPEIAYEALKVEINKSSEDNPLFIIECGPVHVIGEAISRADASKRKFVTIITMLNCWNDYHADKPYPWENHSGWTLPEIAEKFSSPSDGGLKIVSILNQNQFLKSNWKEYEWLVKAPERNNPYYSDGSWKWLFYRLCMSIKPVSETENYYAIDASDAGKVVFLLTGIEKTSPKLCYEIMSSPPHESSKP